MHQVQKESTMGFSRHLLKSHKFLYTKISGEINDHNLRQHIIDLNSETEDIYDLRELADCRDITNVKDLTIKEGISTNVSMIKNKHQGVLAMVIPESLLLYGMARAYQTFVANKVKCVEVFKDINNALEWLANNDQEIAKFNEFIKNA